LEIIHGHCLRLLAQSLCQKNFSDKIRDQVLSTETAARTWFQERLNQNPSQHECDLGHRQKQVQAGAVVARVLRLRLERGMETTAMNQLSRQFLGGFPAVEMPSSTTAWPAVCNRSTEQLPADRTQLEVAHFPSPRSSAACSIGSPTCAWRFSKAASADALAHEDARSPHPRRIAGDDFSERLFPQARPAQKEPSAYFDQIYVAAIAEQRLRLDNQAALR
jgi:hypothetical protein